MNDLATQIGRCLTAIEEMRSPALHFHDAGVAAICGVLCRGLGLGEGATSILCFAAGLHDIGKVVIPDAILDKPSPLDEAEWEVMRGHPRLGYNMLRDSSDTVIELAANVILHHHECWDGSGYPDGLAGEDIPYEARIVALCDVYHALREPRTYRPPLPHETVMGMILHGDGTQRLGPGKFDPGLLAAFRASGAALRDVFESALPGSIS